MALQASKPKTGKTLANATMARLFFLSASSGQVFSANPDGSDLEVIVNAGRRIPDGIVVDVAAGHLYWTDMGNPSANDGSIERSDLDAADQAVGQYGPEHGSADRNDVRDRGL